MTGAFQYEGQGGLLAWHHGTWGPPQPMASRLPYLPSDYGWDEMVSLFHGRCGASPCALGTCRDVECDLPSPCWKGMSSS